MHRHSTAPPIPDRAQRREEEPPGLPVAALLASLSGEDRADLLRMAARRLYLPKATLYRQGELVPALFILAAGCVKESHTSRNGQETILALHGPGDLPGVTDLLEGDPALTACRALEPTRALTVPAGAVRTLLERHSTLTAALLRSVGGAWRHARTEQLQRMTTDAVSQTSQRIVELAYRWGHRPGAGAWRSPWGSPRLSWGPGRGCRGRPSSRPCGYCASATSSGRDGAP